MKTLPIRQLFGQSPYVGYYILFSLLLHILAGIVSTGYHHADEHFQILEPMGWKMGFYGAQDLAWEFTYKIRAGIQVFLGYAVGKLMLWLGVYSPFMLTATLRQITGLLWWALTWLFYNRWKTGFSHPLQQKALLVFCTLLWFLPYLHVRYSSESWGGLLFFAGLYVLLYKPQQAAKGFLWALVAGFFMGLAFYFRFQMGFAIAGLLGWMLWYKKFTPANFFGLLLGGAMAAGIGTLADYWMYNSWQFTPYNYFFQNIVAGKAAGFGTSPFYAYVPMFVAHVAPPISLVLLALLLLGIWTGRKTPWVWVLLAFVLAHSVVAHKEFRFLFPMVGAVPVLLAYGLGVMVQWWQQRPKAFAYATKAFVGINLVLTGLSLLKPANEAEAMFKAFYMVQQENKNTKIAFTNKDPFDNGLKMNFFRYCDNCFYLWKTTQTTLPKNELYIYTRKIADLPSFRGANTQLQYSVAPIVPTPLNIGHWQERTNHGYLWHITADSE